MTRPPADAPGTPHAFPFRLLDRVLATTPGHLAVGLRNLSRGDPLVNAEGSLPAALLAEAMAQVAGVAAAAGEAAAVLVRIERFRCRRRPLAGEQLLVSAQVLRRFGALVRVRGAVRVDGRRWAAAELVLHLAPAQGGTA